MLSIIVPVYNAEDYLPKCIDSILNQTYTDIELLLVDNQSTDDSIKICKEYARRDARIKVLQEDRRGPFYARKTGVNAANGSYVTFVDADDFIDEISYQYASEEMSENTDVICFGIKRFYDGNNIRNDKAISERTFYDRDKITKEIYPHMIWDKDKRSYGIDPSLCNKIFRRDLIRKIYGETENMPFHYGEDVAIFYPFMTMVENMVIRPESYYYHRQRKNKDIPGYILDEEYFDKLFMLYKWLSARLEDIPESKEQIDLFYMNSVNLKKRQYNISEYPVDEIFPFNKVKADENIVIYGAGNIGRLYRKQITGLNYCKSVLWVDSNYKELGSDIADPVKIMDFMYDHIVIAVANPYTRKQIFSYLTNMGVLEEKIVRRDEDDF